MTKNKHFKIWQNALQNAFSLDSILAAAGTAYFAFFSFFPLILLLVAVASRWFDSLWVENELITQLEFVIPGISKLLGENITKVIQARTSATVMALVLLAWASSALFSIVTRILDRIWSGQDIRSRIRYRGLALLFVGGVSVIVLSVLFIGSWVIPILKGFLPDLPIFSYGEISFFLSIATNIILFGILYRFLPHASPEWRDVWIGAITAGTLWAVAKRFFLSYIPGFLSTSNLVYGSVSTIIAFLVWVYFSGLIFFFGAYLGKEYRQAKLVREDEEQAYSRNSST